MLLSLVRRIHRKQESLGERLPSAGSNTRFRIFTRVAVSGAEIAIGYVKNSFSGVLGERPSPRNSNNQRLDDGVYLFGIKVGKGLLELCTGFGIEQVETDTIGGLLWGGGDAQQEVEELRRVAFHCAWVAVLCGMQMIGKALERGKLSSGEELLDLFANSGNSDVGNGGWGSCGSTSTSTATGSTASRRGCGSRRRLGCGLLC